MANIRFSNIITNLIFIWRTRIYEVGCTCQKGVKQDVIKCI